MNTVRKYINLISTFVISALLAVFNLLSVEILDKSIEIINIDKLYFYHWNILVIIMTSILIFLAVITLLFNTNTANHQITKIFQNTIFILNILILISTFIIFLVAYYRNCYTIYDICSENANLEKTYMYDVSNFMYYFPLLLLCFNCIVNLVLSALSLKYLKNSKVDEQIEESISTTSNNEEEFNENIIIKNEITKIKKQIELQSLKEEYSKLYAQLNESKKDSTEKK